MKNLEQNVENFSFWYNFYLIIVPILIYPIMIILELLIHFNLFRNIIIQFIVGIYFFIIPLYPIFFRLDRKPSNLMISENLVYLLVADLSIYVLFAVFLNIFSLSFNFVYVFLFSIVLFAASFLVSLYRIYKSNEILDNKKKLKNIFMENLFYFKKESRNYRFFPKNYLLLLIFLLMAGIFVAVRFPVLYGDDPWFHAEITNLLVKTGSFSWTKEYYSLIGFYSLGGTFQLFTGIDILTIAKWFPVLSFLLGGVLGFTIMKLFFKNDQIAILGGVIFIITPFNMALILGQYWPSSIASILCLGSILFSLKIIDTQEDQPIMYLFLTLAGISSFFVHDFTAVLMYIGIIFVYMIQALRRRKNNLRMIFIYIFVIVFSVILRVIDKMSFLSGLLINIITLPYYLWIGLIIGAIFGAYILHKLIPRPEIITKLDKNIIEKKPIKRKITDIFFQKKFLIIIFTTSLIITILSYIFLPIFYGITQIKIPSLLMTTFFTASAFFLVTTGIITFQRKNFRGDILFFWIIYFGLIIAGLSAINIFFHNFSWSLRIIINASGILSIAMTSYMYIHIHKRNLLKRKNRLILGIFLIGLFVNFGFLESGIYQYKTRSEINTTEIMSSYIPYNDSILISGFRWEHILQYYSNFNIPVEWQYGYLLKIENQTSPSGENNLLKFEQGYHKNNTYLLLENTQMTLGILAIDNQYYGSLTKTELQQYCGLPYLDMVLNSKSLDNEFQQLYWLN